MVEEKVIKKKIGEVKKDISIREKISLNRFNFRFPRNIKSTPILVVLVIIAAFVIGMLVMKVQDLEKTVSTQTTATQAQSAPSQALQQPQPTPGKQNVSIGHLSPKG